MKQSGEREARVIVYSEPLVAGNTKSRYPAAPQATSFRENEIKDKPGDQRRDEGDQAPDIDKYIDFDAFMRILMIL
jgi:hypothetical protein